MIAALLALAALPAATGAAQADVTAEAAVVTEARAFMAAYADDLAAGDRAAIAARYDRRGAHFMGGGERLTQTHAEIVDFYASPNWSPPAAFEWRDLQYEPLGPDAVAVTGLFLWTRSGGRAATTFSYTGLLVRQDGMLRIRIEDEDPMPEAPVAN